MKVRIKSDGTPQSTSVETLDGRPITGIAAIEIKVIMGDVVRAEIEIACVEVDVGAVASFVAVDPTTGEIKPVRRLEFADGSTFEAAA